MGLFSKLFDFISKRSGYTPPTHTCGDFGYELAEDGAVLTEYNGHTLELEIPAQIDGHPVAEITDGLFYFCDDMRMLKIPACVSRIGLNPFDGCEVLTRIDIAEGSPFTMDGGALIDTRTQHIISYLSALTESEYRVPDGTRSIGDGAFFGCRSLRRVILPASMRTIGEDAFRNCEELREMNIPDHLSEIGDYAFLGCHDEFTLSIGQNAYAREYANENDVRTQRA